MLGEEKMEKMGSLSFALRHFTAYGFAPYLVVLFPLMLLFFFFDRAGNRYRICWQWFIAALAGVSLSYFVYFMCEPVPHPRSLSRPTHLQFLFFLSQISVVILSFPVLFLLGFFPPKLYSREKQRKINKILPIGVVILVALILIKQCVYMKDYRNTFGQPGPDAYEIMAFFAQSADTAVGTKSVSAFDINIDIQTYGLLEPVNGVQDSFFRRFKINVLFP